MAADGRSIHAKRPLSWLLDLGHKVVFLDCVNPLAERSRGFIHHPYPRYLGTGVLGRFVGRQLGAKISYALHEMQLRQLVRRFAPDIVHVHWIDMRAWHFARTGVHPLVLTAWGSDINRFFQPEHDRDLRSRVAYALAHADLVIGDSPDTLQRCQELAGVSVAVELLPLGIDTAQFSADLTHQREIWRKQLLIPDNATVFGSFRAWTAHYCHDVILRAFSASNARKSGAYLLFKVYHPTGQPDDVLYEAYVRGIADQLQVSDRVKWVSDVSASELPSLYAAVDVVVNLPKFDAFPVHFLEAMASQRTIVSRCLPSYVWGGMQSCVIFTKSAEIQDVAAAMDAACETRFCISSARNRDVCARMVAVNWDQHRIARRLIGIYENVRCAR